MCVVAATIPAVGVWPWLSALWYGGGLLMFVALRIVALRYFPPPLEEDFDGGVPALSMLRLSTATATEVLWRSLSWPVTMVIVVDHRELMNRIANAGSDFLRSDELLAIDSSIRYEPWVAIFCFAQAAGLLGIPFHASYPGWFEYGAVAAVLCAVMFRCLRYVLTVDLPTLLRRSRAQPYVIFVVTAIFDLAALILALTTFRSLLQGDIPSVTASVTVAKAMFSMTALTAVVTGKAAPLDAIIADIVGKVWCLAAFNYLTKLSYFTRTDDDRRQMARSLFAQGKFEEAIAEIHAVDRSERSGSDRSLEAMCTICAGRIEAGVELFDNLRHFDGEPSLRDDELLERLMRFVTEYPVASTARAEMIVYAAGRFDDLKAVTLADRAAMGGSIRRMDALAVASRLDRSPLTRAMLMLGVGALDEAREIEAYSPHNRLDSFVKRFIIAFATANSSDGLLSQRYDDLFGMLLALFEEGVSYGSDEMLYMRAFLTGSCAYAEGLGSDYGPLLSAVLARYDESLTGYPTSARLSEQSAAIGNWIRERMRRVDASERAEAISQNIDMTQSRLRSLVSLPLRGALHAYHRIRTAFGRRLRP